MTHEFCPNPVDKGTGKEAIARAGYQARELVTQFTGSVQVVVNVEVFAVAFGFIEDRVLSFAG